MKQFSALLGGLLATAYLDTPLTILAQAQSQLPVKAIRVSRYTLGVADLDRTYAFYHALGLDPDDGMAPGKPEPITEPLRMLVAAKEGTKFRKMVFKGTPGRTVEMTEYSGMDLRPATPRIQDPGASLIELYVGDLDAAVARATKAGAKIVTVGGSAITGFGIPNRTIALTDPDGHYVKLTQGVREYDPKAKPSWANLIIFVVDDCARVEGFYEKYFNFMGPPRDRSQDSFTYRTLLGTPGAEVRSAWPNITGTNQYWGLLEFNGIERKLHTFRIPDPGSSALRLEVADIDAAIAAFKAGGGSSITEGGSVKTETGRAALVRDPGGILIELYQP
jgi:predicted enzyme related to lactoylglutathione lyase